MNRIEPGQQNVAPKVQYNTPSITTFGSVAKLTMSNSQGSFGDHESWKRHRFHHHGE